ncbi:MAG: SDR family oxidoreductase [Saprospiraceae bacterium]|nr:SDR family oxidoreductase [Saprospiraceae bacterium]MCF8252017.1 SDR family oxidoreductase [Saprospiraceae bacterium]MCF8281706.1 SDR family oxidoreductase [Bacteroidales bacterium]MCF8313694.1 SDR family oxidoreductase [Saprospiraceae bacterium]MCF8442401.1 SDR family oxidoreductase [Saprospiraceae bacterium]
MDTLFNLKNKVAVITGGSGILCGAIAKAMAERGAKVAILGRTPAKVQAMVAAIEAAGGEALPLVADVLDAVALQAACDTVLAKWRRIDILINGAGGNIPGAAIPPEDNFFNHPFENLQKVFTLNFDGTVLPSMIFGKPMAEAKSGSIINISSMTAQQAVTRVPGYSTAKAAVDCFTKWLAVEVALKFGDGVRVNAIAPGFFITEQNRRLLTNEDGSFTDRGNSVIRKTPTRRFGEPEELIGTAVWLASDASKFVTGTVIPVDGGFSAWSGV